jgi:RNA polymerase sigma factor (sigma-70 family)
MGSVTSARLPAISQGMPSRENEQSTAAERFKALYEENFAPVASYLLARTDREVAAEALSKTFEVAWRRLGDVPESTLPWLLGVARRVLADERRAEGRRDALVERIVASGGSRSVDDPGELVARRDRALEALARLPATQREALLLVAWDGLTELQAAESMGLSRGAFALRVHRARRRLRMALKPEQAESADRPESPSSRSSKTTTVATLSLPGLSKS